MRLTTRRRLTRIGLYVLFFAVLATVAVLADWERIASQFFQWDIARDQFPQIITIALKNTVLFTLIAFVGGLLLGIVFALMKLSSVGPYRWFATAWIELFRGLPALLTIFAMAYVVPIALGFRLPGGNVGAGLVGLIFVASAYMAEVIRAGIQAVPRGQNEAARSLGMSPATTMMRIVLPQGFRIIIPPLTNEFVLLLKDTSLLFIAGSTVLTKELTTFARDGQTTTGNGTPLVMGAMLYLLITIPLTRLVAVLERRMARGR
ncbi:polar amino acid transport system permease protein [Georgenia satyanarayanai]|uniref:Polar amino acid transport system permease protein n=1 Tax=Georgenia satyanarayanai TaxID=860221 RepID=A0A2Y9AQW8_9MICO|nr:amino acid ABC transporter permease [Georgenia satyanarayanai]PYF96714.1 polar amino acid transport system permease protein [Georgenia satyanarayanai]SSA46455.1 polar amino acid transport system permease protein [Georgenia satyanarayanai]